MTTTATERARFAASGLSYRDITLKDLQYLRILLDEQFIACQREAFHGKGWAYWTRVNDAKYFKGRFDRDGRLICAYLTAKGAYFTAREVISFHPGGKITFCNEADEKNDRAVILAFHQWVDWLAARKERVE